MELTLPLATFVCALVLAGALVPASRRLAWLTGAMDEPGHRKIHATPTPRLGGLAIFGSFMVLVSGGYLLVTRLPGSLELGAGLDAAARLLAEAHHVERRLAALLCGACVIFVVGVVDDLLGERFPVWLKALGQLLAALVLVVGGDIRTSFLPHDALNVLVALLWVVGITNAFNLLDNMDGVSAGVALIAAGILFLNALILGEYFVSLILAAFMGSVAGFLHFNLRPGTVFLGDCGSLLIGYLLGSLTLLERYVSHASSSLFPVLMPVVVLAVPIVDTATVVAIRLREGRPIYVGDKSHLSHRLVALGFSRRAARLILYLATAALGFAAFSLTDATPGQSVAILLQVAGIVGLMLTLLLRAPAAELPKRRQPAPARG